MRTNNRMKIKHLIKVARLHAEKKTAEFFEKVSDLQTSTTFP